MRGTAPSATERVHALALALLDRYGILTRDVIPSEGIEGGFAGVYPILRMLEEAGRIRRGYFVEGLGAAQFALAGAIDRLRATRDSGRRDDRPVLLLAAADPANAYGAALAWPRRSDDDRRPFQRAAGAYVALVDGLPVLYLDRGGSSLQTLPAFDDPAIAMVAVPALVTLIGDGRDRELVISKIDGLPVTESPHAEALVRGGFVAGYRGLVLRQARPRLS